MKTLLTLLFFMFILLLINSAEAKISREETLAQLDEACEVAREKKLAPLRQGFVEECVANKEQPDHKACERFYADYGAKSGGRAPLFYDLPECVTAFEFHQGVQSSGS